VTRRSRVLLVLGTVVAILVLVLVVSISFNEGGIESEEGELPPGSPPTFTSP
jgi:hypothetical protein